jgi:hypothetical protein
MTPELAEDIATAALVWLCADPDRLAGFLGQSGAGPDDLRRALQAGPDHAVLTAVLDFILLDDASVIACAQARNIAPERVALAASVLSGRAGMHWT